MRSLELDGRDHPEGAVERRLLYRSKVSDLRENRPDGRQHDLGGRLARIVRGSSNDRLRARPGGHFSGDRQRLPAAVRVRLGP